MTGIEATFHFLLMRTLTNTPFGHAIVKTCGYPATGSSVILYNDDFVGSGLVQLPAAVPLGSAVRLS
jgi:hypothetical protein